MSKQKLIPALRFPEFQNEGEWVEITLGNIGEFIGGGTPDTTKPEYWNGDILWYTPTEVKEGKVGRSSRTLTEEGLKNSSAKLLPKGSLLLTTRATIGDIAITDSECTTNQGFQSLVVNETEENSFWYYWIIQHKSELIKKASGSTFPEIGKNEITKIVAVKPKKKEQQRIASCLSSLDDLIAAHSQKLDLLKDHKKGLMQHLFPREGETVPKVRFKEFEKDGAWELKQLGVDKLIEIKGRIGYRGYTTEDIVSIGEGAISMSPSNIDENWNLNFEKSTYITWDKYEESPEIMLEDGFTVLVKTGSSYGKAAYIKNLIEKTTINPQLVILKPKKIDSYFLYILVTNTSIQKQIQETVVGGAIPTLSQDSISKFEILVPKRKEQEKIANCLLTLNQLIISQTEKIEQLKQHKKGLMQGLFPKMND